MCRSMVDVQSAAAKIKRGKKKDRKKPQGQNIMSACARQGGHKQDKNIMSASATQGGHKEIEEIKQRLVYYSI